MRLLTYLLAFALVLGAAQARPLLVWTPFDGPAYATLERDVSAFAELFDVPVELERHDLADVLQRLRSGADGAPVPDAIVGMPHEQAADVAASGLLRDLSGLATDAFLDDLAPSARIAFEADGALVGLPLSVAGPALLYDRARIDAPPATYDAWVELAERLADADPDVDGLTFDAENLYFAFGWLATHGGYLFGEGPDGRLRTDDVGLDSDGAVRGVRALRALRFEHGQIPSGTDYARATSRFRSGAAAMTIDGPWAVAPARRAGVDVGVAPLPPLADGTPWTGFMTVDGVVVPSAGATGTEIANLVKWLVRSEAQGDYAAEAERVPASRSAGSSDRVGPEIRGFAVALHDARPIPTVPEMGRVWGPVERALQRILDDPESDVRAELERAARTVRGE